MRITGGNLKGRQLGGGFASHVRPTTDMVREAIFNKLEHAGGIAGAVVLDLFSGSGIIAMEFLSRGAERVISVDRDGKNQAFQKKNAREFGLSNWEITRADVMKYLPVCNAHFDFVFADPPYDMPGIQQLPALVYPLLKPDGCFVLEHRPDIQFDNTPTETRRYGSTTCSIFAAASHGN
ncbi:MAG: RsmD family RNA methyltransferase [Bacteroidetes bacterium]|nr:RsmD family RNA methyltransferase [Bacteroidota bacterium]